MRDGAIFAAVAEKVLAQACCFASFRNFLKWCHDCTPSIISYPRIAANFSAVCGEQLLPVFTAVTVPRDTPAFAASWFPVRSNRTMAAAKHSRLIRISLFTPKHNLLLVLIVTHSFECVNIFYKHLLVLFEIAWYDA